jgi:hypothetical protein
MRTTPLIPLLAFSLLGACGDDEQLPVIIDARTDAQPGLDGPVDAGTDAGERACGGRLGATCPGDQYCDFGTNSCGATDEEGVCRPRPTTCPDLLVAVPTCGCDGVVYGQDCEAYMAGTDLDALGGCPVPQGMFACGYTQCSLASQYCQRQVSDVGGEPDGYDCRPLPTCPSQFPTCACLAGEPCGAMCSGMGTTGLTLTCPGG